MAQVLLREVPDEGVQEEVGCKEGAADGAEGEAEDDLMKESGE